MKRKLLFVVLLLVPATMWPQVTPDFVKNRDETVKNLQTLVRIDTSNPPGNETRAAEYIKSGQFGDIVMSVNRSGPSIIDGYLGAYAVYARVNPANPTSITFGPEVALQAGLGSYHQQSSNNEAWGPYSAIGIDPNDPLQFWTTQEFAQSDSAGLHAS